MSHSIFNRRWAAVILEALTRHGVRHLCIAPGSRSAPLTLAAADNPSFLCHTHFDERGMGYLALGLAKASRQPVAIIVTSGTAVANLYPAVIEARLTGERLIVLSADRPQQLIDCGANQAVEQPGLFGNHVSGSLNLPTPSPDIPASWLVSAVDALMQQHPAGAVHLNCPFAEPLYGGDPAAFKAWHASLGHWWQGDQPWVAMPMSSTVTIQADWREWRQRNGLVIVGNVTAEEGTALVKWAGELGWPLIADVQSQAGASFPCAEIWLQQSVAREALEQAQLVVQFGSHLTGKHLTSWLAEYQPEAYWLIESMPGRRDPAQHRSCRIVADIGDWLDAHPAIALPAWCPSLEKLASETFRTVQQKLCHFGEAQLAARLSELLPVDGSLFLGNSLTIRLVNAFARLPVGYPVYANRGASGIDGLLATSAGVQLGTGKPVLAVMGDLSALYDLNSLALLRQVTAPLVLIVVNNNGGQIFSMLPTPVAERERFFAMPQHVNFAPAAVMFGLHYHQPQSWLALCDAVEQGWQHDGATLIELRVDEELGAQSLATGGTLL
ncbi:2-succinyl-5-enolpyruvyl-6-hydroxy-3-cyclohexene-1-carboxylic-acid synthase [Erwinia endophytica]|uniref:2-succinyl-5-enolpyruvyl-6-hydroxy-3- cyclohexene-1-carboxylic-acid synthase n=1 Tax=Erwinia endophytica TaxID=1563158 RepID=UPI001265E3FA|nr:2-succinyl-5-enolpyruvyl-6-hydroxy-3-cyclohexene-1-carboxylic-acid synthase [Erwinia endophytica]KAB8312236.1 2-succinyl-5-enolpyruvyl-6-hydroxy-3-cyclohexene-1-carboxylic-acid synthase [Erwinia endophytica]